MKFHLKSIKKNWAVIQNGSEVIAVQEEIKIAASYDKSSDRVASPK